MEIKEKYKLRILGPNCVGFVVPYLNLNATFIGSMPDRGNIALFSQSGAVCGAILDWAQASKVGFSSFVSVGSMLDVDFGDLIDYFGMDIHTRSIVLYVESITDAKKFMSATKSFARAKPLLLLNLVDSKKEQRPHHHTLVQWPVKTRYTKLHSEEPD